MTIELEQSIMSSLYNMNLINPSEINKVLILIENSCKKHKDRVYYKIQYYYIEPIMKQIKTRKFKKNDNPFITELENTYHSLLPDESKEWLDRVYNEFDESFRRMDNDRDYYFIHDKYPKRETKITTLQKTTTKYTCSRCNSSVLLSSREAHEKTDKCTYFGKETENPRYKEKASPKNTIVKCCNECNYSTSKINIARHRKKCDLYISSVKNQV
jgi:hypothetical protein